MAFAIAEGRATAAALRFELLIFAVGPGLPLAAVTCCSGQAFTCMQITERITKARQLTVLGHDLHLKLLL